MKRILPIVLVIVIAISMVACAKLISTEYETVEVKIVDKYHRSAIVQPIMVRKVVTLRTIPAVYRIIVEYNGVQYTVSGSETYNCYKDRIGETVNATMETRLYDDDTSRQNIVSLG